MDEMKLSDRLMAVADFVPAEARLLDVGSDHAYLPIYLTQQGRIAAAVAGEVAEGPHQSAVKNVTGYGLSRQIEVRLADGLAAAEAADGIDTIVIAGMGGRLISDILDRGWSKTDSVSCLILQPNNREDELRRWLVGHGFVIKDEQILEEAGKFYEIILAAAGQQSLTELELRFGPHLLAQHSPVFIRRWERELGKLTAALAQIPEEKELERSVVSKKIKAIKEVLYASE